MRKDAGMVKNKFVRRAFFRLFLQGMSDRLTLVIWRNTLGCEMVDE